MSELCRRARGEQLHLGALLLRYRFKVAVRLKTKPENRIGVEGSRIAQGQGIN